MELFEDPIFKTKYLKNKVRVKRWESDFMEKYGRKPNKNDIKEADVSIKEAYKMYWKLKTRALEETLTDITFCDDMQDNISNKSLQKLVNSQKQDKNQSPEKAIKDTENIDPHDSQHSTEIEGSFNQSDTINVEGAWGNHLSKNKEQAPKKKQALLIGRSSSFQLSRNKFESSTFTKRNPRKSLSSTKITNKSENNILNSLRGDLVDMDSKDGFDVASDETKPIFGELIKVTYEKSKPIVINSINAVKQLVDGHVTGTSRNLNPGWLDRCARDSNVEVMTINPQRLSGTSDSGIESMESSIYSPKDLVSTAFHPVHSASLLQASDEEDFICVSDSEEERRNKRTRNFKTRLSDQDDRPAKRRCINNIDSDSMIAGSNDIIDNDTFKQTSNVDRSFNLLHSDKCKNKINNDNAFKLINDVDTSSNIVNESIGTNKNIVILDSNIESNVIITDEVASENVCQTKNDKIKKVSKMINTTSKSADLRNQKSFSISHEKSVKQPILRRKVKQVLSDNSDLDYTEEKDKKTKAKAKTNTAHIRIKKSVSQRNKKKTTNDGKEKSNERRKSSKRESNLEKDDEERSSDSETKKIPTYGIEMLQTIPRFAIKPTRTGNLVAQFSESVCDVERDDSIPSTTSAKLTAKEKLEKKMAAGTMNDNFVRINLKKKVFVRGKRNFNLGKHKKNQWKQRKKELASSESNLDAADLIDKNGMTCFKCGESGHFAKYCSASKGDALLPMEEVDDSSNFPTLEEAEKMANENAIVAHSHRIERLPERPSYSITRTSRDEEEDISKLFSDDFAYSDETSDMLTLGHKVPQELVSRLLPPQMKAIDPLYAVKEDGSLVETPIEVFEALHMFGHESFRAGQEKAIMRILSGQSTLVTLSTGSGKSLCYQLPAYLYAQRSRCITLVISPLVSLMDDQVTGVPLFLSAACLHTSQTPKVREQVMQLVKDGKVNILLVSPEAVVAGEKSTGFGALLRELPPIAFVCIDEAHCISQWSHNFRPSYLMVCRVLKEKLHVKTVLGLTATATKATAESIIKHIDIYDGMAGVISDVPLPRNLVLSVSKDENKDQALIALLKSERFRECNSVIVYCIRREECARIAGLLRISLQDSRNPEKPNVKISTIAEAYHAGMTAPRRKAVQKEFMNGKIKIVVATIAFGMGINKSDIRAIIHYNMPGTFEGYVQEVGRAGRDSLTAHCHLFLNSTQNSDKWELRRHIHANGVDRHTIRHLLQRIFIPCSCTKINEKDSDRRCPGHEVALPIDETVQALDITQEIISTLLCYLELHPKRLITVLSSVYIRARVSSYKGPQALKQAAQSSPPLAMATALDMKNGISHENSNIIEFPVIDIASAIGWDSGVVKSHLKSLEWTEVDGKMKRSAISVKYDKLGLRVKAPGDLTDAELDEALDALIARTQSQESSCLQQLEFISSALNKISVSSIKHCSILDDDVTKRSEELKDTIRKYFKSDFPLNDFDNNFQNEVTNEQQIAIDVRNLIIRYRDTKFTGRAVARIFHGIQSPNYPAVIWCRCRFWRIHIAADFNAICKIAVREILALR